MAAFAGRWFESGFLHRESMSPQCRRTIRALLRCAPHGGADRNINSPGSNSGSWVTPHGDVSLGGIAYLRAFRPIVVRSEPHHLA